MLGQLTLPYQNNGNSGISSLGMDNFSPLPNLPEPMGQSPLPPSPLSMSPAPLMQTGAQTNYPMLPQYARGGKVQPQGLGSLAQTVRQHGERGDTILAHINPEEARYLAEREGYDINPYTGLPQFGFFSGIGNFFKKALPIVGAIVGGALGGPGGAILGGGLGGAGSSAMSGANILKGALLGGGMGALGPLLGSGVSALGGGLSLFGMPTIGGGVTAAGHGLSSLFGGAPGGLSSIIPSAAGSAGASSSLGSYIGPALLATAILGTALRKEKTPREPSFAELMAQAKPKWGPEHQPRPIGPPKRKVLENPVFNPNTPHQIDRFYDEVNPWEYRRGGFVNGYAKGGLTDSLEDEKKNAERIFLGQTQRPALGASSPFDDLEDEKENAARIFLEAARREPFDTSVPFVEVPPQYNAPPLPAASPAAAPSRPPSIAPQPIDEGALLLANMQWPWERESNSPVRPATSSVTRRPIDEGALLLANMQWPWERKKGGGLISGIHGGQDDDIETSIPEGSYIVNATDVSQIGDGNNIAGARRLDEFLERSGRKGLGSFNPRHRSYKGGGMSSRPVNVAVSGGEYFIPPEKVAREGAGDLHKGAKKLDHMLKRLRKHKGIKGLPPKAKSLNAYMR